RQSCAACTIGCEHIYQIGVRGEGSGVKEERTSVSSLTPDPAPLTPPAVRLEYESLFALGPLCGVSDREAILRAARLCDDLGIDTVSAGATVAFPMECSERPFIPRELRFGHGVIVLSLLALIARREGLGQVLADGT